MLSDETGVAAARARGELEALGGAHVLGEGGVAREVDLHRLDDVGVVLDQAQMRARIVGRQIQPSQVEFLGEIPVGGEGDGDVGGQVGVIPMPGWRSPCRP